MQSWLIGVGWVVYGGQLFGCWFHDAWLRAWAQRRRDHPEPGGGQGPGGKAHRPDSRE
jgi:membrane protein